MLTLFLAKFSNCKYIELDKSDDVTQYLESGKHIVIKFWKTGCPYCEIMKEEFDKASTFFDNVTFLGANCFSTPEFCEDSSIQSYPTIRYYPPYNKTSTIDFEGDRSADGFADFIMHNSGIAPHRPPVLTIELSDETFGKFKNNTKCMLTAFYAPWCTHCKKLLPIIHKAGEIFQYEYDVNITILNCEKYKSICDFYGIHKYPHVEVFHKNTRTDFEGEKSIEYLVDFINSNCETHRALDGLLDDKIGVIPDAKEFVDQFMQADSSQQKSILEKIKQMNGSEFYLKVADRYQKNGKNGLLKDMKSMMKILNERKASPASLDRIKKNLNVFKQFIPDFSYPSQSELSKDL